MPTSVAIRLAVEGKAEVKQALDETGRAGDAAFRGIGTSADAASAATDRLTRKAQEAAEAARRVPQAGAPPAASAPSGPSGGATPSPATLREAERVRFRLDAEARNAVQLERDTAAIARAEASGIYTPAYGARLREMAERRYGGPGNDNDPALPRRGLDSNQRRDLMYQSSDVVASLGSGAGLGTVAFQQGPQVLQGLAAGEGGLKGGLKALGESALGLVTPMSVAGVAVAGLGAAFLLAGKQAGDEREALEKATQGMGRATGATAAQLDVLARSNAEAGKVSASTAREIVAGYASTGKIALPVIDDVTRATSEYARITGQDVPAATAELARMFADPAAGAAELATKLGGLGDSTRQLIQTQIEQGDRTAAQQTLADSLAASIAANTTATTGWAAAWNVAATAAAGYWEQAKKIAGITLGTLPEGAEEQIKRLEARLNDPARRMNDPQGFETEDLRKQLTAARTRLTDEAGKATRDAAKAEAERASSVAGAIARQVDPNFARLSALRTQQSGLRDALANPLARGELADFGQTETAYLGVTRAIESLTDANGKLVSSEELARRQDALRLDTLKAKTAAEKADVAERQKAFELIGKTVTGSDARGQIERAGLLARAQEDARAGGGKRGGAEKRDDFDRAERSTEDRIRRLGEQSETYGMGAEAIERYRVQQELLTAAQRAGRDVTPELTRQIEDYANRAGEAAKRNEEVRESVRRTDEFRSIGSDGVRSLVRDLGDAKSGAEILSNALSRIKQRVSDLAADSIADMLFGKRGAGGGSGIMSFIASAFGGGDSPTGGVRLFSDGGIVGLPGTPGAVCGTPQGCGQLQA